MAQTGQTVTAKKKEKNATEIMKKSFRKRKALQLLWCVAAFAVPAIFWPAGILPLLFPSAGIKIKGIIEQKKYIRQEVEQKQDGC